MIQVTYSIPFTNGRNLATQEAEAQSAALNQGELALLGLTIASDLTAWDGSFIQRVVQFNETVEFLERVGNPVTPAKRLAFVKNLFSLKLALETKKPVTETIVLL
jgi:hypothetical protein